MSPLGPGREEGGHHQRDWELRRGPDCGGRRGGRGARPAARTPPPPGAPPAACARAGGCSRGFGGTGLPLSGGAPEKQSLRTSPPAPTIKKHKHRPEKYEARGGSEWCAQASSRRVRATTNGPSRVCTVDVHLGRQENSSLNQNNQMLTQNNVEKTNMFCYTRQISRIMFTQVGRRRGRRKVSSQ